MKVNFKLVGVDCAVCASTLENAINKLPYVKSATLNFVDLKLYVETCEDFNKSEQELEDMLQSVTSKVLPNVIVKNLRKQNYLDKLKSKSNNKNFKSNEVTKSISNHTHISNEDVDKIILEQTLNDLPNLDTISKAESSKIENQEYKINWFSSEFVRVYISAILFVLGLVLPIGFWFKFAIYLIAYIVVGYDVVLSAFKNIIKGKFLDEKFLTSLASISAFCINEMPEAVAVMLLFQVGELFQDNAVNKSRSAIGNIVSLKADYANKVVNGNLEVVEPEYLHVNDLILIKVGEKVPTDVEIVKGETNLDVSSITGESLPKYSSIGSEVLSGSINISNPIYAKVISEYQDSTVAKILDLVENNTSKKSKAENFITKFAKYYTPIVVCIAVILFAFFPLYSGGIVSAIHKSAVFLVISCPCALVISIPLTYYCGLGVSAKNGLLIKGANVLDNINNLKAICFDKTGTITKGEFKITEISAVKSENEMLKYLVYAESTSNHPIAKCIVANNKIDTSLISSSKEILGKGIVATIDNNEIVCGNQSLFEELNINYNPQTCAGSIIYVAKNKEYLGYVVVSDIIKDTSKSAMQSLKNNEIKTIMLTGDNQATAEVIAFEVGIDNYKANLLPQDKVTEFENIKTKHSQVAFVGDGVNDAPVLSLADVGYAMGLKGSDSAIEHADVVIMNDDLNSICDSIKIAKGTRKIAIQNIVFCLIVKFVIMILGAIGLAPMYLAIFADVGVSILAILNSIRIFTIKFNNKTLKNSH